MKKQHILLTLLLCCVALFSASAEQREARHIFEKAYDAIPNKAAVFKPGGDWFPYPAYEDREGWDKLTGARKKKLIAQAEKWLDKDIPMTLASQYLITEKTATRKYTYGVENALRSMTINLAVGELVEGKGRFLPKLIDVLYYQAERATWSYHVHTSRQSNHRALPRPQERVISLGSAHTGEVIALAWHFFHKKFDEIDPSISKTIWNSIDRNILSSFLDESLSVQNWWIKPPRASITNNQMTYTNKFVLMAFLLCEKDPDRLLQAIKKSVAVHDRYMDFVELDGGCEEGPGYWDMAAGKVYDYTRMLYDASGGRINLFGDEQIRRQCEFYPAIYAGDGMVANFGDGSAFRKNDPFTLFRMGIDCKCPACIDYALTCFANTGTGKFSHSLSIGEFYRTLEALRYDPVLLRTEKKALADAGGDMQKMLENIHAKAKSTCYPQTDITVLRNASNWFVCAKGAHNGQSHNHNDAGSCVFYLDCCPILVDAGAPTYGKSNHGANRYKFWPQRSDWHNLPDINGQLEQFGAQYATRGSHFDEARNSFSTDISQVYAPDAKCERWIRDYELQDSRLIISDTYELTERIAPDVINFLVTGDVFLPGEKVAGYKVKKGEAVIAVPGKDKSAYRKRVLVKASKGLTPSVVQNDLKNLEGVVDPRFSKPWKNGLRSLRFTSSESAPLKGSYSVTFTEI